jgi:hypothetical protein
MMTAFVITGFVVVVAFMFMRMTRPRGEWIGKMAPALFPGVYFRISQQTGIKLRLETVGIAIGPHQSNRLSPVAERFLPFLCGALRHIGADILVTRGPPLAGRRNLKFRSGQIKTAYLIVTRRKPEETFRSKNSWEAAMQQLPKFSRMKRFSGAIGKGDIGIIARARTFLRIY